LSPEGGRFEVKDKTGRDHEVYKEGKSLMGGYEVEL